MNPFEAIVLGLTQGLTEFIPVSSSGHLEIMQNLIGNRSADFHIFLELINFGTLLALLIYFRKRIMQILTDIFKHKNYKLAINVIITSIPAATIGLVASKLIETAPFFSSLITVACAMAFIGILMIIVEKLPKMSKLKDENKLTKPRALIIGLAQVFALVPGTSRSGSTIIAGRLTGLDSKSAAEYSFLASIPIMCGVMLKTLISSSSRDYLFANLPMLLLSNAIAFVSGLAAIYFILGYLKKQNSLKLFGRYRVVLALLVLIIALIQ